MSNSRHSNWYESALARAHEAVWTAKQAANAEDRLEEAEDLHAMLCALSDMAEAALRRRPRKPGAERVFVSDAD